MINNRLAIVAGRRIHTEIEAYRRGHVFGNLIFTRFVEWLFGRTFTDILSGYRVFSRAFAPSFPTASRGVEIETDLTVHALTRSLQTAHAPRRLAIRTDASSPVPNGTPATILHAHWR